MIGFKSSLAAALFSVTAGGASAATTVSSSDNGWYESTGFHQSFNPTTIVGECTTCGPGVLFYNNFFVFDLGALAAGETVVSATLTLFGGSFEYGQYGSDDASETLGLFDYVGSIDNLVDGTGGVGAFEDLGNGTSYGEHEFFGTNFEEMPQADIALNAAAIAAINAALASDDQRFVIGGSLLSILAGGAGEVLYNASSAEIAGELTINTSASVVPLPGSLVLLGTAIAGLAAFRRRVRQSAA